MNTTQIENTDLTSRIVLSGMLDTVVSCPIAHPSIPRRDERAEFPTIVMAPSHISLLPANQVRCCLRFP